MDKVRLQIKRWKNISALLLTINKMISQTILSIAEFVANNNNFASIRLSPVFASRGLYPCMSFDVVDFSDTTTCERINKKKPIDISESM